ncbi:hypothetical protein [Methylobacterium sp. Leaf361]|uniref:hypothetical protein n=1 Tax=Methylobacterium sp. Leaf361 TaxID=1736352 RepID=UPI000A71F8D8|nr:hypothetical protein [Methylobacterium sp. Leaf361]
MSTMNEVEGAEIDPLEAAAELAIELRAVLEKLPDPGLRAMVDLLLIDLGTKIAARLS